MIRAVLFDIGNVLWDDELSDRLFMERILAALVRRGISPPDNEVAHARDRAITAYAPSMIRAAAWTLSGCNSQIYDAVMDETMAWFQDLPWTRYQELTMPLPGAHELLAELRGDGFKLGIVSNNISRARDRLAELGLLPYFHAAGISQIIGLVKPDPRIFLHVLKDIGVEPHRAAMVGDRLDMDIYPAHLAGLRAIRVLHGSHRVQQPRYPRDIPDAEVSGLPDIAAVIRRWRFERKA